MVSLIVIPGVMLAMGRTQTFGDGVAVVLKQTGVLPRVKETVTQVFDVRDRLLNELAEYLDTKLSPRPSDSSDEAAGPVSVRRS